MQIVLFGKVNTTGDIGFQVRLLKRRYDEIKSLLAKESIDDHSVLPIIGDRDQSGETKANAMIQVYLIKN
ncbi:hypothetical protein [Leptospira noumeaensis]|uniref:hypothetical protein n=1 Tax=Leptospira noumeaensis TaxID=2484964 RepID=UPI001ABF2767|nr:hypothetical protein [Leptospira noumeaensis]